MKSPESNRPSFPLCRHLAFACPPFQLIILQFRFLQLFFFFPLFKPSRMVLLLLLLYPFSSLVSLDLIWFSVSRPFSHHLIDFENQKVLKLFARSNQVALITCFRWMGVGGIVELCIYFFLFFFSLFSYRIYRSIGADTTHDDDVLKNRFVIMKRAIMATMERLRVQRGSLKLWIDADDDDDGTFYIRKGQVISLNWFFIIVLVNGLDVFANILLINTQLTIINFSVDQIVIYLLRSQRKIQSVFWEM
jgi:hypothetical protein